MQWPWLKRHLKFHLGDRGVLCGAAGASSGHLCNVVGSGRMDCFRRVSFMLPRTMGPVSLQRASFVGSQGWIDNLGLRIGRWACSGALKRNPDRRVQPIGNIGHDTFWGWRTMPARQRWTVVSPDVTMQASMVLSRDQSKSGGCYAHGVGRAPDIIAEEGFVR